MKIGNITCNTNFKTLTAVVLFALGCSVPNDDLASSDTETGIDTSTDWDTELYDFPFQDPDLWIEHRVNNIIALMTLEEKIEALDTRPSVPRLDIEASGHMEGLHGVAFGGPGDWTQWSGEAVRTTTQFPQVYGLGATWDPAVIKQVGETIAYEARYLYHVYNVGSLVMRVPNADLARDPRWGRTEESFGEDPYLTGTLTVAMAKGLQGDDPHYIRTASLMKHFLANSNENGREMTSSDFSERLLREYYAVPFRMGIVDGGAQAFMAAYNLVNDIPCTVHPIMRDIAMDEWGLDGIICTDAGALANLPTYQVYTDDIYEGAALAIKAGINQFLDSEYFDAVSGALERELITEAEIDDALKGSFRVMIRLGLLDPPGRVPFNDVVEDDEPWGTKAHKRLAQEVTRKSIVLLKNDGLLPLDKGDISSIAVIGAVADEVYLDWYSGTPPYAVTPLEGIRNAVDDTVAVEFAATNENDAAASIAAAADAAVVVVGNDPICGNEGWAVCAEPSQGREAKDREEIALDDAQLSLVQAALDANPHTVVVVASSFPYAVPWIDENAPAILHMAHNSQEMGRALAEVIFGDYNPAGRLTQTWPRDLSQLPDMLDYDITHGRTYMYFDGDPLYPFGFGLSYTEFEYANLTVSASTLASGQSLDVSVDVTNKGARDGEEVVQLYVAFSDSDLVRPRKALKGFARVAIPAGETETVTLTLDASQLTYWNEDKDRFVLESGDVTLMVGASSDDIRLEKRVSVSD